MAQFVADFLGFWDWKPNQKESVASPGVVYQHLSNCQDYLTYNSDVLSVFPRRINFNCSINWLSQASIYGIKQVKEGRRKAWSNPKPNDYVEKVKRFGTSMAEALLDMNLNVDLAAAIRLSIALDAVHKSVLMVSQKGDSRVICTEVSQFTEVLNYLLHTKTGKDSYLWTQVKDIVYNKENKDLSGYILEAQRLACHVPLVRQIADDVVELPEIKTSDDSTAVTIQKGTVLLIDVVSMLSSPWQSSLIIFPLLLTTPPNPR